MTPSNDTSYDFMINDEDEVMLLLYARETEPKDSIIEIINDTHSAILYRNKDDSVTLTDIPDEVIDSLEDTDKLLVCELSSEEDEKDTKIIYAYEAEITD